MIRYKIVLSYKDEYCNASKLYSTDKGITDGRITAEKSLLTFLSENESMFDASTNKTDEYHLFSGV